MDLREAVLEKALDFLSGDYVKKILGVIWEEEGAVLCLLRSIEGTQSIVIYTKPSTLKGLNRLFFMSTNHEEPYECSLLGMRDLDTINLADVVIDMDEESRFD